MTVIKVENLSKKYIISHQRQERYTALRDVITNKAKGLFSRGIVQPFKRLTSNSTVQQFNNSTEEFFALKDVSFEIKQGERVGIIGRNGAGKTTVLKLLSRITEPTSGRIEITGRVASLLEVGTGFHPELTGRENIFLNGAILGMGKSEIKRKLDEIVEFAEIEKFLDTPVKRYSSGMYVRLAFAVAAHLEPEILVVDEVLAVGDASFQKKCLGKMEDVAKEGRTVLFVSHNMAAIKALCSIGILLDKGCAIYQGDVLNAVKSYQEPNYMDMNEIQWPDIATAPGNENIRLKSISVKPSQGNVLDIDSGVEIVTTFYNKLANKNVDFTLYLFTLDNICLFETGMILSHEKDSKVGYYTVKGKIPPSLLNCGTYKVNLVFGDSQRYVLYKVDDILSFEVQNTATGRGSNMGTAPGIIRPILEWIGTFQS